ncbi:MAG: glycosyltransferase, partial [Thermoplasmatales archaeon]
MKIIILVRILWTSGAQKIAIEEAKTLTTLGHEVKLVFLREAESGKHLKSMLRNVEYEIFSQAPPRWIYSEITGLFMPDRKGEGTVDYDLLKDYSKSIKGGEADYIICHDQWAGIAGLRINKSLGVPYSVFCHERITGGYTVPVLGKYAKKTERNVLKNATKVFGVTKRVACSVQDVYGIEATPNLPGMDLKEYASFSDKKNVLIASAT